MMQQRFASLSLACLCVWMCACGSKSVFASRYARAYCHKIEECLGAVGLELIGFDDFEECMDEVEDDVRADAEDCDDWDEKLAKECVDEVEDRKCTEFDPDDDACADLYIKCR